MGKIILQLLSCLYLYDSGIFRCQYALENKAGISASDAWRWHTVPPVYRLPTPQESMRKAGIPASDATGKFAQSRYTGFWRPKG